MFKNQLNLTKSEIEILERILDDRKQIENDFTIDNLYKKVLALKEAK